MLLAHIAVLVPERGRAWLLHVRYTAVHLEGAMQLHLPYLYGRDVHVLCHTMKVLLGSK